jgi:iron complex outermembrane receptor protein
MPITNTIELGYKGILENRLLFSLDGFYSQKKNFVSLIQLETPFVYLSPDYIRPRMIEFIASGDPVVDDLVKQLGIGRSATVGLMTTLYSQTPSGIVQPDAGEDGSGVLSADQPNAVGGLLTYRNFGKVQYVGLDLGIQFLATYKLTLFGNLSLISDNFFDNKELKESNTDLALALNAPTVKTSFGFLYSNPQGATLGMSARYVQGFPVLAGPYVGGLPAPYGNEIGGINQYFIVDMNLGYSLGRIIPGLRLDMTINNLFGYKHREFVGAPQIGRLALLQATFAL